jgi:hypothetical protein
VQGEDKDKAAQKTEKKSGSEIAMCDRMQMYNITKIMKPTDWGYSWATLPLVGHKDRGLILQVVGRKEVLGHCSIKGVVLRNPKE